MKKIIGVILFLSLGQAFASSQTCSSVIGEYACNFQGDRLNLSVVDKTDAVEISIAGGSGEYILDGQIQPTSVDDTEYVAECKNGSEIIIDNYFKGELKGSVSISKTDSGVDYILVKNSSPALELSCKRL